jgi:NitT/TauT family transport system substrate-binding protein
MRASLAQRTLPWALLGSLLAVACSSGASPPSPAPASGKPAAKPGGAPASQIEAPRPLQKMTVPYTPIAGSMLPLWMAIDERIFQQHGLEVTPEFVGGSSPIIQAMLSGQWDISVMGGGAPIENRLQGGDLLIVGSLTRGFTVEAWAAPTVRSLADLKGRTVAVTRFGSTTHYGVLAMLSAAGLSQSDTAVLQVGGVTESMVALLSGQVDVAMLAAPQTLEARKAGFYRLGAVGDWGDYGLFPQQVVSLRESWIANPANRDTAIRFMRALQAGVRVAKTDAAATKRALRNYTKVDDEESLQETFEFYSTVLWEPLVIEERSVTNALQLVDDPRAKDADPKQFIDNSLVEAIGRS